MGALATELAAHIRRQDGDIWPAFSDRELFARTVAAMAVPFRGERYTKVVGVEARGFVLGGAMAAITGAGFVPIRKDGGHLPGNVLSREADPDWKGRRHRLLLQRDAIVPEDRIVLIDDWLETGSQALAARALIEEAGATLVGVSIIVDDLRDEVRPRIGRLHALMRADELG